MNIHHGATGDTEFSGKLLNGILCNTLVGSKSAKGRPYKNIKGRPLGQAGRLFADSQTSDSAALTVWQPDHPVSMLRAVLSLLHNP